MVQPIDHVQRGAEINFTSGALARYPQLTHLIMQVIGIWAHIDGNVTYAFSKLIRTDIETATTLFDQFNGARNREQALVAAAKTALPEWQWAAIQVVYKATSRSRKMRNDFAHHILGCSKDISDALLMTHPKEMNAVNVAQRQPTQYLPDGGRVVTPREIDRSRVFVWREADLESAVLMAKEADTLFGLLSMSIGFSRNEVARRELFNMESFQKAVKSVLRNASAELKAQLAPPGDDPPAPGIWKMWDETLKRNMARWEGRDDIW